MIDKVLADAATRMAKTVESTKHEFQSLRTGRASAALLDRIRVTAYGAELPLNQVSSISVPEPRLLVIQPFDKSTIRDIERALMESDLGITPSNDGQVIRLPIPTLTEQRRKEMVKIAHKLAEEGRVAIRNVRRDAIHQLKDLEKAGDIGKDDAARAETRVQKLTDDHISHIDAALKHKEAEILEV